MSIKLRNQKNIHHKEFGQSAMEFALVLPILLILVISTLEVGRLFFTKIVITNAAREAAYYLSLNPSDYDPGSGSAPKTVLAAQAEASNSGVSNVSVSITPKTCIASGQQSMQITVETEVPNLLILGFVSNIYSISVDHSEGYPLSSSVEMMVQ